MSSLEILFWLCACLVAYTYAIYPLALIVVARGREMAVHETDRTTTSISFVLVVHNEESRIANRVTELKALLRASGRRGEIIVVSDGSTDATARLAKTELGVKVVELQTRIGKAAALTRGCGEAVGDILILADVRQRWATNAANELLEKFASPDVGAVGGELVLQDERGMLSGVGLYWRYEKLIRRNESRLHSTVGVSGAIAAVRRSLFHPIPADMILDDVYWPLKVVMSGYRVVYASEAKAFDRLPAAVGDEFHRKVRTLAGNYQLIARLPSALVPWRNRIWLQYISHKVLRLIVPWALIAMFVASALSSGAFYRILFFSQAGFYGVALVGLTAGSSAFRFAAAAGSFVMLNAAAWVGFWVWVSGRAGKSWRKAQYDAGADKRGR
jgi:cellulose synthase/poly-beta-1,6-N-acetylglucosamine synthase-like glycosyltransferase